MAFDKKYSDYGVLKIDGNYVKVHSDSGNYITISVGENIASASWAGSFVNVTLQSGKVKRYSDSGNYTTI